MTVKRLLILFLPFVLAVGPQVFSGCDTPEGPEPHLLDTGHPGWKNPRCDACHELPVEAHETTHPPACAVCHGGNGACDPGTTIDHEQESDCLECHDQKHGFENADECILCHFAAAGLDTCSRPPDDDNETDPPDSDTDEGASLSDALESNCYDWPEKEFTVFNRVQPGVALSPGDRAVEFVLKDTNGTDYSLSSLLNTKPVFLVFGSFT